MSWWSKDLPPIVGLLTKKFALWDLRVGVVGIRGGSLFVLMIETPHTLHTHSRSSLYIYNAIQHLQQWLPVIRMPPHPDICYLGAKSEEWMPLVGGYLLVLMIETPHTLHTHSRSSLYIYNAIEHLQQWLPVIRMQPHPDICSLRPESGCCWYSRWVSVSSFD